MVDGPVELLQLHHLRGRRTTTTSSPQTRDGHRARDGPSIAGRALHRLPLVLLHAGTAPGNGPGAQVPKWLATHGATGTRTAGGPGPGPVAGEGGGHDVAVTVGAGGGAGYQGADQTVAASQGPFAAVSLRI